MKATVIGCGYVGSRVARLWHEAGIQVTATTTTKAKESDLKTISSKVVVVEGNDLSTLERTVAEQDVVLLSVGSKESTIEGYEKAYLETAKNVVKAIASSKVKQLIYTSSYGILSNKNGDRVDESILVEPATEKGKIMHEAEKVLLSAQSLDSNFNTCIFRLSGIYGKGRELIKIFKSRAGSTQPGSGADLTNWVHIEDIVRAIDYAQQHQLNGIYNLTSDEVLTTKEFFQKLFQAHNLAGITWDSSQPSTRRNSMKLDNQKLKDTGFEFIHPQIEFR